MQSLKKLLNVARERTRSLTAEKRRRKWGKIPREIIKRSKINKTLCDKEEDINEIARQWGCKDEKCVNIYDRLWHTATPQFHVCKVRPVIAINCENFSIFKTTQQILLSSLTVKTFPEITFNALFSRPKIERKTFSLSFRLSFFIKCSNTYDFYKYHEMTHHQSSMMIFNDWGFRFWNRAHADSKWMRGKWNCLLLLTRWEKFFFCFVLLASDKCSSCRRRRKIAKRKAWKSFNFLHLSSLISWDFREPWNFLLINRRIEKSFPSWQWFPCSKRVCV